MDVRVNVALLMKWSAVVGLAFVAFVVFIPMTGWSWTGGLAPLGCVPSGLCSSSDDGLGEVVAESRAEGVAMWRLLECQRYGLSRCEDLRTLENSTVQVIVSDAFLAGGGMLLSEGLAGRDLRYVELVSEYGSSYGSFFCAYGDDEVSELAAAVEASPNGAAVLFTAELRWGSGSSLFRTYDDRGDPACQMRLLDGKRL